MKRIAKDFKEEPLQDIKFDFDDVSSSFVKALVTCSAF